MIKENSNQDNTYDTVVRLLLVLLAIVALGAAIWRLFASAEMFNRLDSTLLLYLGVAGALLLLRDVKSLAFGDYKVEFERVRKIAKEAENKAENAQSIAMGIGKENITGKTEAFAADTIEPNNTPGDPWKNRFGGKSQFNNRQLQAQVSRIAGSSDLFSIQLRIFSTLPDQDPLRGVVQFFLHPTFKNDKPIIYVGPDGVGELKLTAWGAFTVGALADEGSAKLELDLSELSSAPREFRER